MSKLSELIDEAKKHQVTFVNAQEKQLVEFSLLLTIILAIAMPQLSVLVLLLAVFEVIGIHLDGRPLTLAEWQKGKPQEPGVQTTQE